ncbi:ubiquitin-specific protease 24 [Artemisia annua]|uniref:Ubiquitin-specific protease 24 n=1 Tax=Artemisia annua TaxID=35608 RepID=A0A2U1LBN7_ARTAN|nr:ubiquitin-specific protease 24 [Artemisia annua]
MPSGLHSKKKNDNVLEIGKAFLPDMFEPVLNNFTPDMQNHFSGRTRAREEDAQEFICFIMNQMHNELIKFEGTENGKKGDSVSVRLREIFGGKLVTFMNAKGKTLCASLFMIYCSKVNM